MLPRRARCRTAGRCLTLLVVVFLTACRHLAEDPEQVRAAQVREAVDVVMQRLDPYQLAVILAHEGEVPRVRAIVGADRRVESLQRFATEHPDGVPPYNILFQSAQARGSTVLVKVRVPGIDRTPPEFHGCGTGFVLR
jgi:hypothetical protein